MEHNLFLPMIMESSRGSSAIIMEISRSSIYLTRRSAARQLHFHHSFHESPSLGESSDNIMEIGHSSISLTRRSAARWLHSHFNGEPNRKLCHHHGDRLFVDLFFKRCARAATFLPKIMESPRGSLTIIMEIGRSSILFYQVWQEPSLPTQDHGESNRELCHHHGHRLLLDSFIPIPMESPRGTSAIIMEFRRRTQLI